MPMHGLAAGVVLMAGMACAQTPGTPVVVKPAPVYPSGAATALGQQIAALLAEPGVSRAHWGIAVTALDGTPVWGMDEGQLFRPASVAKMFTTTAAVHLLDGNSRQLSGYQVFVPSAPGTGGSPDVVLEGLGIASLFDGASEDESGDGIIPAAKEAWRRDLNARPQPGTLAQLQQAAALYAPLIQHNTAGAVRDVVGDDSLFCWEPYGRDWAIDDAVWGYGAPVSALPINDNQLRLTVTPGTAEGALANAALQPAFAYYTVQNEVHTVIAGEPTHVRVERLPGSRTLHLTGEIAIGQRDVESVAIDDPAAYTAVAFAAMLKAQGITVTGVARANHRNCNEAMRFDALAHQPLPELPMAAQQHPLNVRGGGGGVWAIASLPRLFDDVTLTLKTSQNLHAEMMLRLLGGTSLASDVGVLHQFLLNAGLDGGDFVFYDGSGLSGHDLVTPRATVQLLAYAAGQPWFAQWKAALPVGGVDGTLASRFKDAPLKGHVFAKTGTLGESRALAGYVDAASGRTVVFSIFVDNHMPGSSADRVVMDKIVAAIAAAN